MLELGSRERRQPAPTHVVWESLTEPRRPSARPWLDLLPDETEPNVLDSAHPHLVVWSSLWPDRPDDRIRFDLRPVGQDCGLRWTLTTTGEPPSTSRLGHLRYRLNLLVNDRLRRSYGQ
ncbi:hypothetical protein [Actinokineospora iranica]|uniref:hypothetical protein n=1 Tax=Actinokineospora iranica TaxID=1271860 RepID=UPI000B86CC12|nr:hypothetical protein [Actinokineospora iranica]